ncbi:hypothetical protein [Candidatus Nitronereus thalassa]|uniref:Uncharacterized protein n=1 Tax=Candidatus Nitronereus thalassa TaxID=3020898 RepID=A0ABU3KD03_9BACT|nr:hypothetical protein [Candidatus Nitronereus thalassa]MDT7044306.1 hypothetical protein [Candidatus Nitronereus thalassa]
MKTNTTDNTSTKTVAKVIVPEFDWNPCLRLAGYKYQLCVFGEEDENGNHSGDMLISGPGAVELASECADAMLRHFGPDPEAIWVARAAFIHELDQGLMMSEMAEFHWKEGRSEEEAAEGRLWIEKRRQRMRSTQKATPEKLAWLRAWQRNCTEEIDHDENLSSKNRKKRQ